MKTITTLAIFSAFLFSCKPKTNNSESILGKWRTDSITTYQDGKESVMKSQSKTIKEFNKYNEEVRFDEKGNVGSTMPYRISNDTIFFTYTDFMGTIIFPEIIKQLDDNNLVTFRTNGLTDLSGNPIPNSDYYETYYFSKVKN